MRPARRSATGGTPPRTRTAARSTWPPWSGTRPTRAPRRRPRRAADSATSGAGQAPLAVALLTKREREIGELVASGLSNREIAGRLFISKRTVDAHVDHIFSKLEISSRVQLTVLLREAGRGPAPSPASQRPRPGRRSTG